MHFDFSAGGVCGCGDDTVLGGACQSYLLFPINWIDLKVLVTPSSRPQVPLHLCRAHLYIYLLLLQLLSVYEFVGMFVCVLL